MHQVGPLSGWHLPNLVQDADAWWGIAYTHCPSCKRIVIKLVRYAMDGTLAPTDSGQLVRPKAIARAPLPSEVPDEFATDYKEACLVFPEQPEGQRCSLSPLPPESPSGKRQV